MASAIHNLDLSVDVFFDLLSESTEDYLYVWDIQNGLFHMSDNSFDELQISRQIETNVISVWSNAMIEEDQEAWLDDMQLIHDGKKDYHDMEYRIYNKKGEVIWVSCRGKVKRDENGLPQLMVGRISNIGKQNKFDNVTGLMNRQQFEKDLKHLL